MLSGVFPPITTPFKDDGRLDQDALAHNVERWGRTRLSGLVVLGSNGEAPLLDDEERDAAIRTAVEAAPSHFKIIAGTGRESTPATIRATERAARLGAHFAIVVNPHYYKSQMDSATLLAHYRAVADASPIPILLYNASPFTGVNLGADLVVRLAEHPNIVGVKDTSGNIVQIAEIARMAPKDFATLAGSGSFFLPTLAVGGVGGILALANVAADLCVELYDRFQDGDLDAARRLHQRLLPVNAVVTSKYGIAGLKAALDLLGFVGGLPRPPLRPLTPEQHEDVRRTLTAAELI